MTKPSPTPTGLRHPHVQPTRRCVLLLALVFVLLVMVVPASARAAAASPGWMLDASATPTNFSANDNAGCASPGNVQTGSISTCDRYVVAATNAGSQPTDGSTITLADTLPAGVTVQDVSLFWSGFPGAGTTGATTDLGFLCSTSTSEVQCQLPSAVFSSLGRAVEPNDTVEMVVYVAVDAGASGMLTNTATVSGGGAATVSTSDQNQIASTSPPFGVSRFTAYIAGLDGTPDTQAGGHPWGFDTTIDLNTVERQPPSDAGAVEPTSVEDVRDVVVDLPLGFLGSATATPTCPIGDAAAITCPADTQVGHITTEPGGAGSGVISPIWNIAPERGVAAEFAYNSVGGSHLLLARVVPGPNGYVLQVTSPQVPQVQLTSVRIEFYGDPATAAGLAQVPVTSSPMFTNPTDCNGQPVTTTMYMDSWQHPGSFNADGTPNLSDPAWVSATSSSPPVTGCDQLQFQPAITVQPDTTVADSPSGLHVDISVPQPEDPLTLATPPLKDASVTLPPGFTVNPSSAAGLAACTPAEIALGSASPPTCPSASQIGTVQLQTPLIPGTLQGQIYLASEFDNPFNSLLAGYIVVNDPTTGVVIKIPGNLTPNPVTGQITGVFDNNPQFPFSDLQLDFKGGVTGVLATPGSCGSYTTNSILSPWSFPDSGPAATPSDSFSIDSGCVSGFSPSFTAGTQNAQAGRYSPFVLSMSRSDTDQNFQGLSVTLPPGMLAKLAGVQECSDQQLASISTAPGTGANELTNPSCPAGSQVGTVETGAGTGPDPFFLQGKAYLTGPYKGAPYGLAVVVPAVAGPLDLGTVVVRQALYINPTTAQVTDVSDPFPTILDGIPLRIRTVSVDLNRPDFTVNPTSCNPMSVTGTLTSTGGLTYNADPHFQVGGCQDIGFSPKLRIALSGKGKTKSGDHPTLTATLTARSGQANIRSAKVTLPLSMALDPNNSNHVCKYSVATAVHGGAVGCPTKTIVGKATAVTPLLSKPLTGNVYLVQGLRCAKGSISAQGTCPGGKTAIHTLPTLLVPLRGQIALDLRAKSSVNGAGALVTTFSTIPDAPVSKFTLQIAGGKKGLLVVTGRGLNICAKKQVGDADFGAQSGKTMTGSMTLSTPCAGVKHKTKQHGSKRASKSRRAGLVVGRRLS